MDEAVSHESGVPVFYKGDVAFSSLVVERLKIQGFPDDKHYTVYYAGTGIAAAHRLSIGSILNFLKTCFSSSFCAVDGRVYKVVQWLDETTQQGKSELLDIFEVTSPEPIRMMEISPKVKWLILFLCRSAGSLIVFCITSTAQIDLRHFGSSNSSSQRGHVQRALRQLLALRPRSLLRLG